MQRDKKPDLNVNKLSLSETFRSMEQSYPQKFKLVGNVTFNGGITFVNQSLISQDWLGGNYLLPSSAMHYL
jgi:hypothetical protein